MNLQTFFHHIDRKKGEWIYHQKTDQTLKVQRLQAMGQMDTRQMGLNKQNLQRVHPITTELTFD